MRDIHIEDVDHLPLPIIAIGNYIPDGRMIPPHLHRRGQLISSATGVLILTTHTGTWVVPPQRGLWIPPATEHWVQAIGIINTQSLYLEPGAIPQMPNCCQVVGISPFMRSLLTEAVNLPPDYDPESRAGALMRLIRYEMQQLPVLPLSLPYPAHEALAACCRRFMQHPTVHETIDEWSEALGMSRRAFTRLFKQETGLSFMAWRQQACLMVAMPRLVAGESVTAVAMDLGYENPASFSMMFKRTFGHPPLTYLDCKGPQVSVQKREHHAYKRTH